ncbi:hypothetical protein A374_00684 [Fictibacillus macauensis ZFHKF-1]|uniref:DUF2231 domain-containing protein n=1 Tax=Fictibacillus macauensis ZFHKF-1 TaxID=1196324 RepID=I8AMV1_9BACL|nr:DUF2231 domain-containing protein [Fictibacillus macauensis]EIT87342.1 hypothetical protein A374_00684 [Fictibacillus macauensis ZFHKF-1]
MFSPAHPILVHFPIALLTFGVLAQLIALWRKDFWDQAAFFLLATGFFTGILAYISGDGVKHFARNEMGTSAHSIIHTHENFALATLFLFGAVVFLKLLHRVKLLPSLTIVVVVLILAGFVTLSITGHYGGKMVYHPEQIKAASSS